MKKLTIVFGLLALVLLSGCAGLGGATQASVDAQKEWYVAQQKWYDAQRELVSIKCPKGCSNMTELTVNNPYVQPLQRAADVGQQNIGKAIDALKSLGMMALGIYGADTVISGMASFGKGLVQEFPESKPPLVVRPEVYNISPYITQPELASPVGE